MRSGVQVTDGPPFLQEIPENPASSSRRGFSRFWGLLTFTIVEMNIEMNGFEVIFTYVVPAFCGLIAGIAGSLVAPWIHWGIEKKREKLNYRRKLIERWRSAIEKDFEQLEFSNTVLYSELRPHLSQATKDSIEGNNITIRVGRGGNVIKSLVLDDIANLERAWNLL